MKVAIQFGSVVVLSRLLSPDDFGLIAMVTVFVAFGEMLRDLGMTTVGLQRRELPQQQASNLFWVNTSLGLVMAVALSACSGLLVAEWDDRSASRPTRSENALWIARRR